MTTFENGEMMIEIGNKKNCCGCGACVTACPQKALSLQPDEDGFLYPQVEEALCVQCGICSKVCAYQTKTPRGSRKVTYAADAEGIDRTRSASGGVFAGLAKAILERGGVVFGSAMQWENGGLRVRHIAVENAEDLVQLQGSKYVQSAIGDTYAQARDFLEQGRPVLFSGTPCQVAGLYGYLGNDAANLYTVDIVCHGVPSEQMFRDYIHLEEEKKSGHIVEYYFRDKSQGWKLHGRMTVKDQNGDRKSVFFEPEESSYYQLFLNGYTYRENCYSCPYAGENRSADLTIGDFWGIEVVQPELLRGSNGPMDETKGISCLVVNTSKGEMLLKSVPEIRTFSSTFEKAQKYNGQLREPSRRKPEREKVLQLYRTGYENVEKWYRRRLLRVRAKRAVRRAIPPEVKRTIRMMLGR